MHSRPEALTRAFAHVNLRRNPFGELLRNEWMELGVTRATEHLEFISSPGRILQFLGDCGRGKTTHLMAIRNLRPQTPYTYVDLDGRASVDAALIHLVDEIDRLRRRDLKFALTRADSMAVGTHRDMTSLYEKNGFQVQTIRVDEALSDVQLQHAFNKRIQFVRRNSGPTPFLPIRTIQQLRTLYGSDIRAMESALYEQFQTLTEISDVTL